MELIHEAPIYAESIFHIGSFPITNSMITSWIALLIVIVFALSIKIKKSGVPSKLQSGFEIIFEGALNLADSVTGSRKKSFQFLPFVLPLFFFILINNWLGLVPGVGSVGIAEDGRFVPILRGATADLNTTLALSMTALFVTHLAGVILVGFRKHLSKFVGFGLLFAIPKEITRGNYEAIAVNPIKFFVGLIEIIGELSKTASLSLRLFGNVFAGEILLSTMSSIFAFVLPIPFLFLEVFVGLIQAVIFATLSLAFLSVMTEAH